MSDLIASLTMRVAELERRVANICRIAQVSAVDTETATLTVDFEGLKIAGVPYLTQRAGEDQVYWLPSVGELGVLFAPGGDVANALFIPGIFYKGFVAGEKSTTKIKRIFRDGTEEEVDVDANSYKLSIVDRNTAFLIESDTGKTALKRAKGKTEIIVGTTEAEVTTSEITLTKGSVAAIFNAICASLVGAQLFPSGLTTFQTAVGPVFFAPAAPPATAPTPPSGSDPKDGKATKVPASTISGVDMSGTITLPAIPITGTSPSGAVTGITTAGTYTVSGDFTLTFPSRSL